MGRRPLVVDASLSFRVVIVSRECCSWCTLNQCLLSISKRLFAGGEWVVANAACESLLSALRIFTHLVRRFPSRSAQVLRTIRPKRSTRLFRNPRDPLWPVVGRGESICAV